MLGFSLQHSASAILKLSGEPLTVPEWASLPAKECMDLAGQISKHELSGARGAFLAQV